MDSKKEEKIKKNKYPLNRIYFYLTSGCNLQCRHCWIAPKYENESLSHPTLSSQYFRSIIGQAKPLGLASVKLTGGEPLLHPQILDILKHIKSEELNLTIETNGVLCTSEIAREIKACKNPSVAVSLDGANAETHEWVRGVPGCFDAALEGIRNLVNAGFRPQIIMTIMRRNKNQVEALIHLAETLGAGSVKINILQPTARGESMHNAIETLDIKELIDIGKMIENTISKTTKLRIFFDYPLAFRPLGKMFGKNRDGHGTCGILGILGVLANGSYALCGIGESVPDLIFGHAEKDNLEHIWNNTIVLVELREGLPYRLQGICGDCIMKSQCLGSCIAQNFYRTRKLWEPFWFCEEAQNLGLFPETRLAPRAMEKSTLNKWKEK